MRNAKCEMNKEKHVETVCENKVFVQASRSGKRARPGLHAAAVTRLFGPEAGRQRWRVRRIVPVVPGRVTLVCGDSGSGKSTVMRELLAELRERGTRSISVDAIDASSPDSVVDTFCPLKLEEVLALLSRAGLAEAGVMLRRPGELSEGQRFRYRLARAMALCRRGDVLLADEFGATLDRTAAKVVAYGVSRWVAESGITAVVATSHDDLAADLRPVRVLRMR